MIAALDVDAVMSHLLEEHKPACHATTAAKQAAVGVGRSSRWTLHKKVCAGAVARLEIRTPILLLKPRKGTHALQASVGISEYIFTACAQACVAHCSCRSTVCNTRQSALVSLKFCQCLSFWSRTTYIPRSQHHCALALTRSNICAVVRFVRHDHMEVRDAAARAAAHAAAASAAISVVLAQALAFVNDAPLDSALRAARLARARSCAALPCDPADARSIRRAVLVELDGRPLVAAALPVRHAVWRALAAD